MWLCALGVIQSLSVLTLFCVWCSSIWPSGGKICMPRAVIILVRRVWSDSTALFRRHVQKCMPAIRVIGTLREDEFGAIATGPVYVPMSLAHVWWNAGRSEVYLLGIDDSKFDRGEEKIETMEVVMRTLEGFLSLHILEHRTAQVDLPLGPSSLTAQHRVGNGVRVFSIDWRRNHHALPWKQYWYPGGTIGSPLETASLFRDIQYWRQSDAT
jgi:hypothetical protein